MESCIFCKIISNDVPAHKLYEDDHTLAFLDINPSNPGHTLVIPKDHFENLYTLPQETLCRLMITAQKVAIALKQATEADGINVIINNEPPAGQIVFHAHFHIIPRHDTDSFPPWPHQAYIGDEAEKISEKIRVELRGKS